jgi:sugar lactone lactonase YvrE
MVEDHARRSFVRGLRHAAVPLLVTACLVGLAGPAQATPRELVIVLPGATSAEGIATGAGSTFYAGDILTGDIFRGDICRGTASLFIDAPPGRFAVGMKADLRHGLLFVAGGFNGQGYAYDLRTGATVATYQFASPDGSDVNDVIVTPQGAWFTDSFRPQLYFVPVTGWLAPGPFRTLAVTGPAAEISGDFNLNGIEATPDGQRLVVAHSANGRVYTVDPTTGASEVIAGVEVPNVDGIVLRGRQLWAVQNADNRISRWRLDHKLTSGRPTGVIESANFAIPTTAALFGDRLAAVNAHFDTGFPPTAPQYEVVVVRA